MTPTEIVNQMMAKDAFSQWLGAIVKSIGKGTCTIEAKITDKMVNGFLIAHGGISYSLSDSALAFAANAYGNKCVSIETSISHVRPAKVGDIITAKCIELNRGKKIGVYQVTITNQEQKKIALFKGTVHISASLWKNDDL